MHAACVANIVSSAALLRLMAALFAVSCLVNESGEVLAGQRMSRVEARSTLARDVLGWQFLQQLEHELFAES